MDRIRVGRLEGGRPRTRPDHVRGDKAYSSRRNRRYLRRRQIKHTIAEPKNQRANRQSRGSKGGRPTAFDRAHNETNNYSPDITGTSHGVHNTMTDPGPSLFFTTVPAP
jgi:hypothetical protein